MKSESDHIEEVLSCSIRLTVKNNSGERPIVCLKHYLAKTFLKSHILKLLENIHDACCSLVKTVEFIKSLPFLLGVGIDHLACLKVRYKELF